MPLVDRQSAGDGGSAPAICPDRQRKPSGKGCTHLVNKRCCTHADHLVCEEYVRRNANWQPSNDPDVNNTVAGLQAQRALDSDEGAAYRERVATGSWFSLPNWRQQAKRLIQIGKRAPEGAPAAAEPASKAEMVEMARQVPDRINLARLGKFRRYPLRKARTTRECAVCHRLIEVNDQYHDGGAPNLRAHQTCVKDSPIEISMVGPPTLEDVDDLVQAGNEIMLETPTLGCLWLVPKHTGKDRKEMTFHQWRALCVMALHFPGSRFTRVARPGREQEDIPGDPVEVRCTCHPEARDTACPVRAKLGEDHPLATRALLECECKEGWTVEQQREKCPIGRAFGGHSLPSQEADDGE